MIDLLLLDDRPPTPATQHAFGGLPRAAAAAATLAWPTCVACGGPMRYLGRLGLGAGRGVLLFQCGNAPGLCDEWDADAGGNRAVVVDDDAAGDAVEFAPPPGGHTLRATRYAARVDAVDADDYDAACATRPGRAVLG